KAFELANGGYPMVLEYKDFVDLATIKDKDGKQVDLKPGNVLEYWLEAEDACDYPDGKPNVGQSKHYKVQIATSVKESERQKLEKQRAGAEQQQHEKKQDKKLDEENAERQKQRNQ